MKTKLCRALGRVSTSIGALALVCGVATSVDAWACGAFFRATTLKTVPSLEVEQVLIVHDPVTEEEQFVREIVFRDASAPFGFVVPTPSQPTVHKVERSPFAELATRFDPEPPEAPARGLGAMGSGAGPTVEVLSQQRVGSFTAFVLAATDAGALAKWLKDNHLTTTPESTAWLKHYVDLGFYFTAFRYEVTTSAATSISKSSKSETVRLAFKSPLPFYPYREPDHAGERPKQPRVLAVWFVGPERYIPVAAVREPDGVRWKRPWTETNRYGSTVAELGRIVGNDALGQPTDGGAAARVVQTFQDQKRSRQGWGDVVMVPASPRSNDAAKIARMSQLMASLDSETRGDR